MKKIGLTGGIGSGKTLVAQIFSLLGIQVFNTDETAKNISQYDPNVQYQIRALFGEKVITKSGHLDRTLLASIVFGDHEKLKQLNKIIHPAVGRKFHEFLETNNHQPYILKESAILVETGLYSELDALIVVESPLELRIKRLAQHRGMNEKAIQERMANQMAPELIREKARWVIHNDEKQLVIPQILAIHQEILDDSKK